MKKPVKQFLQFLLFFAVGFTILFLLYRSLNANYQEECVKRGVPAEECNLLEKVFTDFQNSNWWWLLVIIVIYILSNIFRAVRWHQLLKPIGCIPKWYNSFFTIMLGYFANLGLPRIGEFVRAGTFAKYEKIAPEKVMGTIVVDRIFDFICLGIMIALGLFFEYDKIWTYFEPYLLGEGKNKFTLLLILGFIAVIGLAAIYFLRKQLMQTKLFQKLQKIGLGFWDGLKSVKDIENISLFIFNTIGIWACYYFMIYFCFYAYAPTANLTLVAGLTVFIFGSLGMVFPSPGGMGAYHVLVIAALMLYNIEEADAFSFVNILFFTINIGGNIILGILALILLPRLNSGNDTIIGEATLPKK